MDSGLLQKGLIGLKPGEVLRLRNGAGRHLSVLQGTAWVTQDGDLRDTVVGSGENFRFKHDGLALVMPLGTETRLVLEDGIVQEGEKSDEAPGYFSAHGEDMAYFERRAQQLRAKAFAQLLASIAAGLKALWRRLDPARSASALSQRTTQELRALSDRTLNDIGLRRDQIDCVTQRVPC